MRQCPAAATDLHGLHIGTDKGEWGSGSCHTKSHGDDEGGGGMTELLYGDGHQGLEGTTTLDDGLEGWKTSAATDTVHTSVTTLDDGLTGQETGDVTHTVHTSVTTLDDGLTGQETSDATHKILYTRPVTLNTCVNVHIGHNTR